jgi:hypothetical protein
MLSRIDLAGGIVSKSASDEAAGSGGSDLQVIASFSKPVENLAVAGGKGHLEVRSRLRGGHVQHGVDESGSGAHGQVAGLYMKVGVNRRAVGSGADGGFSHDLAVLGQGDVLRCAGHVGLPGQSSLRRVDSSLGYPRLVALDPGLRWRSGHNDDQGANPDLQGGQLIRGESGRDRKRGSSVMVA